MVDVAMAEPASARDAPEEQNPEMLKQQAQLLEFNEYIHKCRDLYKSDPTMVSSPRLHSFLQALIYRRLNLLLSILMFVSDPSEGQVPEREQLDSAEGDKREADAPLLDH